LKRDRCFIYFLRLKHFLVLLLIKWSFKFYKDFEYKKYKKWPFSIQFQSNCLFKLSLAIPLLLLIYKSLIDFHDYGIVSYGKWALMIILIFFFNLIYWIFDDSISFLLFDMTIKCALVFLPQNLVSILLTIDIKNINHNKSFSPLNYNW
jgi:hypothetical protein